MVKAIETELVATYMLRLENADIKSIRRAEISEYLKSIGIKGYEEIIEYAIKNKILISLSNGKLTLNKINLRKNRKST